MIRRSAERGIACSGCRLCVPPRYPTILSVCSATMGVAARPPRGWHPSENEFHSAICCWGLVRTVPLPDPDTLVVAPDGSRPGWGSGVYARASLTSRYPQTADRHRMPIPGSTGGLHTEEQDCESSSTTLTDTRDDGRGLSD